MSDRAGTSHVVKNESGQGKPLSYSVVSRD